MATKHELAAKVAGNLEETSDQLHVAVTRNQPGQAQDYAAAIRDLAAAYRDLQDDE